MSKISVEEGWIEGWRVSRRSVLKGAAMLALAAQEIGKSYASTKPTASTMTGLARHQLSIELEEWSFFWVGLHPAEISRGAVYDGKQIFVEYQIPKRRTKKLPVILVHDSLGQASNWMSTPDGRPGWSQHLLQMGYAVYLIDLPGHGRNTYWPSLQGDFGSAPRYEAEYPDAPTFEQVSDLLDLKSGRNTQWPRGTDGDDTALAQYVASLEVASAKKTAVHAAWSSSAAQLMDKIGPAIIMTHGDSAAFAWLAADRRPGLVEAIVAFDPPAPAFNREMPWGATAVPLTFDPPVSNPAEFSAPNATDHRMVNLSKTPIAVITSGSPDFDGSGASLAAWLKKGSCSVDQIKLVDKGFTKNSYLMMLENNNQAILKVAMDWVDQQALPAPALRVIPDHVSDDGAMWLAEQGGFWVGVNRKTMPYGTIAAGQMFVQYFVPHEVKHDYSIVLVHGGGGQGLHWMGAGNGQASWVHYYVQQGFPVYIVDRTSYGRSPYHPDALGPRGAGPGTLPGGNPWWPGESTFLQNTLLEENFWASGGTELVDKIGPVVIQTHTNGGPFAWRVADKRPGMVRAIIYTEVAGPEMAFSKALPWGLTAGPVAYDPPAGDTSEIRLVDVSPPQPTSTPPYKMQAEPPRRLKNIAEIPVLIVSGELAYRRQTPTIVAYLKQAGVAVEDLRLETVGLTGNGALMMTEPNRKQIFDVLVGWLARKIPKR